MPNMIWDKYYLKTHKLLMKQGKTVAKDNINY